MSLSSAYHPQTNSQTERTNQTLEQYLRCFTSYVQDDRAFLLSLAEFAYNNFCHSATKQSLFLANYEFHPTFLSLGTPESPFPAVQVILQFFVNNTRLLQATMSKAKAHNKKFYDRKQKGNLHLQPGDKVWLSAANFKLTCASKKLGPKFVRNR